MNTIFKTVPYAHQQEAFNLSKDSEVFALFPDPGTGKTKIILDTACHLFLTESITGLLVIAPSGPHRQWAATERPDDPLPKHLNCEYRSAIWRGDAPTKERLRVLDMILPVHGVLSILSMNIEAINTERGMHIANQFLQNHAAMLVIDESTRIKHYKAARTKRILQMADKAKYRRILTGTPVTEGAIDLYTQFRFLDWRIIGHKTFAGFRAKYCVTQFERNHRSGNWYHKVVGYKNLDELKARIAPHSYWCELSKCFDMPEKVYEKRYVEMSAEQEYLYAQVKEGIEPTISTKSALEKIVRLQQLLGGCVPRNFTHGGTPSLEMIPSNRTNVLLETIEDLQGKIIIWAQYKPEIRVITDALAKAHGPDSVVQYYGDVPGELRALNLQRFVTDPKVRFFVATQQSGGTGLDALQTAAAITIYYSNDFSLEQRLQSEARVHRLGQESRTVFIDLVCKGTLDEKVLDALRDKRNVASLITGETIKEWI